MSNVVVELAEGGRLVAAALAASQWPMLEQAQQPHATHLFAKQTRQWGQTFAHHRAVVQVDALLAAGALPAGVLGWGLADGLEDFAEETAVYDLWQQQAAGWETAVGELHDLVNVPALARFLTQLTRQPQPPRLLISPNLLFPALTPMLAAANNGLQLLLPPPKAVGTSPPWPYREDPGWVMTQLAQWLLPHLLAETLALLPVAQQATLAHAAVTTCLAATLDPFEAQSYLLKSKKQHNLPQLPQAVAQLEQYLAGDVDNILLGD